MFFMTEKIKKISLVLVAQFALIGFFQIWLYPVVGFFWPVWVLAVVLTAWLMLLIFLFFKVQERRRGFLLIFMFTFSAAFVINAYAWRRHPTVEDLMPGIFVLYFIIIIAIFLVAAYYPNRRNIP
jgi:hypothetical protein